jgi:WD40 repeat protein
MSYCLNPDCHHPQNLSNSLFCQACGAKLLLVNRYRAIRLIGQGGFGRTLLAEDESQPSQPRCVIKQLYPKQGNTAKQSARLFQQEAEHLARLGQHPRIPKLLAQFESIEQTDDRLLSQQYIVQEYIDGENLADELKREGAFSEAKIWALLGSLLPVLQFIHAGQVIHRDIKPANIIRRRLDQELVLVDFGAAKDASAIALSKTGTVIGSAIYAAPEQIQGKALPASDLYSLGMTCIHLLTDISPFDLYDPLEGVFIWQPYLGNRVVTEELSQMLDRMIHTVAKYRYSSAAVAIAALPLRFSADLSFDVNSHDIAAKNLLGALSEPSVFTLAPLASASGSLELTQDRPNCRLLHGHVGKVYAVAFSQDGQMIISGSGDHTIRVWDTITSRPIRTISGGWWLGHADLVCAVTSSPDGQIFASGSWDKTIKLWHLYTGDRLHLMNDYPNSVNTVAFSPDGALLASGSSDRAIKLWDTQTGQKVRVLKGHTSLIQAIAFHPSGDLLASGSVDRTVRLWDVETGKLLCMLSGHTTAMVSLAFSPSGEYLAAASWDNLITLWQPRTGKAFHPLIESPNYPHFLSFSPDGERLAIASRHHVIRIWQVQTRQELAVLSGHTSWINSLSFSPDGKTLVSGSSDKTVRLWRF